MFGVYCFKAPSIPQRGKLIGVILFGVCFVQKVQDVQCVQKVGEIPKSPNYQIV